MGSGWAQLLDRMPEPSAASTPAAQDSQRREGVLGSRTPPSQEPSPEKEGGESGSEAEAAPGTDDSESSGPESDPEGEDAMKTEASARWRHTVTFCLRLGVPGPEGYEQLLCGRTRTHMYVAAGAGDEDEPPLCLVCFRRRPAAVATEEA